MADLLELPSAPPMPRRRLWWAITPHEPALVELGTPPRAVVNLHWFESKRERDLSCVLEPDMVAVRSDHPAVRRAQGAWKALWLRWEARQGSPMPIMMDAATEASEAQDVEFPMMAGYDADTDL